MINVKVLRIGNILDRSGVAYKITAEGIYWLDSWKDPDDQNVYAPIVVNAGHLKSFGFKEGEGNYCYDTGTHVLEIYPEDGEYLYPVFVEYQENSNEFLGSVSLPRLKYVHELQNLFFALTGRELEMPEK